MDDYKYRRNILRNYTRPRNTVGSHPADYDKKQIQDNIENTRDKQINKRSLCIAVGTQNTVAEVENAERRHTERIYPEIQHGAVDQVILRVDELQHLPCKQKTKHRNYRTCGSAYDERRVNRLLRLFFLLCSELLGDLYVYAAAQTDKKAGKQRDKYAR
ncbi:unknown [Ruminococcus sp. CAG:382]|nr:unknown [Ruminococcus sp. CAG:382]